MYISVTEHFIYVVSDNANLMSADIAYYISDRKDHIPSETARHTSSDTIQHSLSDTAERMLLDIAKLVIS